MAIRILHGVQLGLSETVTPVWKQTFFTNENQTEDQCSKILEGRELTMGGTPYGRRLGA